jgi:hypothetical protein
MQRADYKVLLDSCVLANFSVCDLLLRLAETPRMYSPFWSRRILDDVQRVQKEELGWPNDLVASFRDKIGEAFPEALVDEQYRQLESLMLNDKGDRHVLAAAVHAKAEAITTFNLRHFPAAALEPWGITALHPADYLVALYSIDSGLVVSKLTAMGTKHKRTLEETLIRLQKPVPMFVEHVAQELGLPIPHRE